MKTGMSIQDFNNVVRQAESLKADYEVKTSAIRALPSPQYGIGLDLGHASPYRLSEVAHEQLASMAGIPRQYYGKLLQTHPTELSRLINTHLREDEMPQDRFIRTIGTRVPKVRAILSTRYGVLDHVDVASMLNQTLAGQDITLKSIICTERRLTFQFLAPRLTGEVKVGDVVQAGLAISNSEVGLGKFMVEALLYRLVCLNGAIAPARNGWKLERIHRGQIKLDDLRTYTQERMLALPQEFESIVNMSQRADGVWVAEEKMPAVVDRVRRDHGLTQDEADNILVEWWDGRRQTAWGLVNAINYQAHSASDGRSVELERIAGSVLDSYY